MMVHSREIIFETETETYFSKINMTLLRDRKTLTDNNNTLDNPTKIRSVKNIQTQYLSQTNC